MSDEVEALRAENRAMRERLESSLDTASETNKLRGWKEIAAYLHMSEDAAQRSCVRERDPLPVSHDHIGIVALKSALDRWKDDQRVSYRVHLELERLRREKCGRRRTKKR